MTFEVLLFAVMPLALDATIVPSDTFPPLTLTTDIPLKWRLIAANVTSDHSTEWRTPARGSLG